MAKKPQESDDPNEQAAAEEFRAITAPKRPRKEVDPQAARANADAAQEAARSFLGSGPAPVDEPSPDDVDADFDDELLVPAAAPAPQAAVEQEC